MAARSSKQAQQRAPLQPWTEESPFELPEPVVNWTLENDTRFLDSGDKVHEFFTVKFCPYQPLDADPVFAAVSKKHVVLCKLSQDPDKGEVFKDIKIIRDDNEGVSNCCCTWVQDPSTGTPYLCIGGFDALIKIYDVIGNEVVDTLIGHGGGINDLVTSPADSTIIASASDDATVRIWSVDPIHREQPCLCILAGEAHLAEILTTAIHDGGRYVLSGGHDHRIALWTLPDLKVEAGKVPYEIHYPHFLTSALHGGIVDCVAFYEDLILSKANHDNVIVLWQIVGFSSMDKPLPQHRAPQPQISQPNDYEPKQFTRSAFVPSQSPTGLPQYQTLLQFHTPDCDEMFFMRFVLHFQPKQHPILTFCNRYGEIFLWDLERVRAYGEIMDALSDPKQNSVQLPKWLGPIKTAAKSYTPGSGLDSKESSQAPEDDATRRVASWSDLGLKTVADWNALYSDKDGSKSLEPHKRITVKVKPTAGDRHLKKSRIPPFVGRQAAWSPGGEWCVVAGSLNLVQLLRRWKGISVDERTG